jgi:hypothetical protein
MEFEITLGMLRQTSLALNLRGEGRDGAGRTCVVLPPAPTPQIGAQLGLQSGLIDALDEAGRGLRSTKLGSPQLAHSLSLLLSSGAAFHVAADKGAQMLASHLQAQKETLEREQDSTNAVRKILTVVAAQSRALTSSSAELSCHQPADAG